MTLLFVSMTVCAQQKVALDSLYGDWTGESKCVGNNPSCHDEVVVYHVTLSKEGPAKVHLAADKIVDGKLTQWASSK